MNPRVRAYLITIILAGLVASPLIGAFSDDSFPVSTYPMFAAVRETDVSVPHVILIDEDGEEWPAPPPAIANEEVLQAQATIRQALRHGDKATEALCERVASWAHGSDVVLVQIVTSTYDAVLYYEGDKEPLDRTLHVMCEVSP